MYAGWLVHQNYFKTFWPNIVFHGKPHCSYIENQINQKANRFIGWYHHKHRCDGKPTIKSKNIRKRMKEKAKEKEKWCASDLVSQLHVIAN